MLYSPKNPYGSALQLKLEGQKKGHNNDTGHTTRYRVQGLEVWLVLSLQ